VGGGAEGGGKGEEKGEDEDDEEEGDDGYAIAPERSRENVSSCDISDNYK